MRDDPACGTVAQRDHHIAYLCDAAELENVEILFVEEIEHVELRRVDVTFQVFFCVGHVSLRYAAEGGAGFVS
jgi:hypothetical protein